MGSPLPQHASHLTNQTINQPISQPTERSTNQLTSPPTKRSSNEPINQPNDKPTNQSINQPTTRSTNEPTNQLSNPSTNRARRVHAPLRGRNGVQAHQQHGSLLQRRGLPRQQDQDWQGRRNPRARKRCHVHRQTRHRRQRHILQKRRQGLHRHPEAPPGVSVHRGRWWGRGQGRRARWGARGRPRRRKRRRKGRGEGRVFVSQGEGGHEGGEGRGFFFPSRKGRAERQGEVLGDRDVITCRKVVVFFLVAVGKIFCCC